MLVNRHGTRYSWRLLRFSSTDSPVGFPWVLDTLYSVPLIILYKNISIRTHGSMIFGRDRWRILESRTNDLERVVFDTGVVIWVERVRDETRRQGVSLYSCPLFPCPMKGHCASTSSESKGWPYPFRPVLERRLGDREVGPGTVVTGDSHSRNSLSSLRPFTKRDRGDFAGE